jgi:hypothetical protein
MGKSRNRKDHKKKVLAYKKRVEDAKKSFQKKMRSLMEQQQHAELDKQISSGQVQSEQVEGLNIDDFKLDEPSELDLPRPSIVEGITNPSQL